MARRLLFSSVMPTKLSGRIGQARTRLAGGDPDRAKSTVLVVDDEKGPRESLRMILSPEHRVLVATDGHEALAIMASERVDAVTVDLNMPGMKGDALFRWIRKDHPQTEVIVITGYGSLESAVEGLRHGIFDYLSKPFDVVQVSNTVRRALARRESRERLIAFLRGIGEVLGVDATGQGGLDDLPSSDDVKARLREAIDAKPDADAPAGAESDAFLQTLSAAIESRDPHRVGHGERVSFLAGLIADRLGLTCAERDTVRIAGFLHDLGRIAGHGEHAEAGAALVAPLGYAPPVADAIRHHHDHWDGGELHGAPVGDEIPLPARIIAVADAYDVLAHDTAGRKARPPERVIAALRERSGRDLDPDLLKELIVLAESGASSTGPLLGLRFEKGEDPADTIAAATAWLEVDR